MIYKEWRDLIMQLSEKGLNISESLTLAISAKAKKMKEEGYDVIGFGAGEPDFDTPEYIKDAAREALDIGFTGYTSASGTGELKEAICEKFKKDNNLNYRSSQIIISNGAKHSLFNTFQAIINPGDEVIIQVPYWVSYPELVKMAGGKPVFVETDEVNNFKLEIADLKKKITKKTKAIIVNSPCNPTGSVYNESKLKSIAELAVAEDFFVVSDEIYEKIIYDGQEHISIASFGSDIKERTIVINGMSKTYAMTGWRIGYAAADEQIINIMSNIQSHSTSNPNSIAQYASVKGLKGGEDEIRKMIREYNKRREYMIETINNIDGLSCTRPRGAFYVMLNFSDLVGSKYKGNKIEGSLSFADYLLEAEKVAVVPGIAFGADNLLRLSYATSMENIAQGLERIANFTEKLE